VKPANLPLEEAAAEPMSAFTALQGLRDRAQIRPGKKVLITGASGGVGTYAVQMAEYSSGFHWAILWWLVPSGRSRSMRIIGLSGRPMSVKFLVRNSTTSFAPSSRCASKYHHSCVPWLPSVRSPHTLSIRA
jgi:hypothetical protein